MAKATPQPSGSSKGAVTRTVQFESLLDEIDTAFRANTDEKKKEVHDAVTTLASLVLDGQTGVVRASDDTLAKIESIIADLDDRISKQLNVILHHEEFQKLESAWLGLWHLVSNTNTDETLKIKVFNISKRELYRNFKNVREGNWDQTPIFKKVYEEEFGVAGGQPFGLLVGDYEFTHSAPDVKVLREMAKIAACAHAPFISAAGSELLDLKDWRELSKPRDISTIFAGKEYAAWQGFRNSEDSRYVGLTMPRFLARLPYGEKTNPVAGFAFEEEVEGEDHARYAWANSAYAMAANITRAFNRYGWTTRIRGMESGGIVSGLPCHTFPTDDGGVDLKCPTEIAITDRREHELANAGLIPLCHYKNQSHAVFFSAESVHRPKTYDEDSATANAKLSARLPYLFATCRFAHYLKSIVRDKIGSFKEKDDLQEWLNKWIIQYVTIDARASDEVKARMPLAEAKVEVYEVADNPGFYRANFWLRPHFQLEGLSASLRLVSDVGKIAGGGK